MRDPTSVFDNLDALRHEAERPKYKGRQTIIGVLVVERRSPESLTTVAYDSTDTSVVQLGSF
jgi:hypothetical protein